jgi:hypothetical protein
MRLTDTSPTSLFFQLFYEGDLYEVEYSRKEFFKIVCLLRKETIRYWLQLSLSTIPYELLIILLDKQKELRHANKPRK